MTDYHPDIIEFVIDCPQCHTRIHTPWTFALEGLVGDKTLNYELTKELIRFACTEGDISYDDEERLLAELEKSVNCKRCGGSGREPVPMQKDKPEEEP